MNTLLGRRGGLLRKIVLWETPTMARRVTPVKTLIGSPAWAVLALVGYFAAWSVPAGALRRRYARAAASAEPQAVRRASRWKRNIALGIRSGDDHLGPRKPPSRHLSRPPDILAGRQRLKSSDGYLGYYPEPGSGGTNFIRWKRLESTSPQCQELVTGFEPIGEPHIDESGHLTFSKIEGASN